MQGGEMDMGFKQWARGEKTLAQVNMVKSN